MRINIYKLNLFLARECKTFSDLRKGTSPQTLRKIKNGEAVRPCVVGRIAKALNCDPADLIDTEGNA